MNMKAVKRTSKSTYVFTYDVFYEKDGVEQIEKSKVTATLDYDIADAKLE